MAQLIVNLNNQVIKRVKLEKPSYTIGRHSQCDVVLPERTVSNQHAKIIYAGEDCFLEDTNSTNGIFINNRRIKRHLLIDNDVIRIGKYKLTFRNAVGLVTQLRQLSMHPRLIEEKPDIPWLEITSGRKQGNIILLERDSVTLGDTETGKVTVERTPQGEFLLHHNGDGQAGAGKKLNHEDSFQVGDIELVFNSVN